MFYKKYVVKERALYIPDYLKLARAAFRLNHLSEIKRDIEQDTYEFIRSATDIGPESKGDSYIDLARSVVNVSRDDAAVYFNFAIEAVSKFGDEIVERWEAIVSLANRRKTGEHVPFGIAYRFIRCAELIGENVAREKYWDRDEAVRTCVRLSPVTALAAVSRWRDREINRFGRQLFALAEELILGGYVSPKVAWSLSAFMSEFEVVDFALICIQREPSYALRKHIFDSVIKELRINGVEGDIWNTVIETGQKYSLRNNELDEVFAYTLYSSKLEDNSNNQDVTPLFDSERDVATIDWEQLLGGVELNSRNGIREAILRYGQLPQQIQNSQSLWEEVYNRISDSDAVKFLYELINTVEAAFYDIKSALSLVPNDWHRKVSVKAEWSNLMKLAGRRFASALLERGSLDFFTRQLHMGAENIPQIQEGIIEGLASTGDLVSAETFFGFITAASERIATNEATHLLEYALSRFELHMDDEFADGPWADWLVPSADMDKAFSGFIWSALGSPRTSTRWRAAHCVRKLADVECTHEIDAVMDWMERDVVDAFGASRLPFYNLHARLYLLVSLSRISIDKPQILHRHSDSFCQYALYSSPHILIQKYAADIALNIERVNSGTFKKDVVELLQKVGISQFTMIELEEPWETKDSYWHENKEVNTELDFYHGYDFKSYWFEPLGRVFGIPSEQIEELVTDVIINEWHINHDGGYQHDPRHLFWRSSNNQQDTHYDHGTYPKVDAYNFYLSLHAMFVVAANLLEKMPVVLRDNGEWHEDKWSDWLNRHLLTGQDGYWLYDRRDKFPLLRRDWVYEKEPSNWRDQITNDDFLDGLLVERGGELWLNVFGFLEDGDSERVEGLYFTSSLVSTAAAKSLLSALSTCSDAGDFRLPGYEEDDVDLNPFKLIGWVTKEDEDSNRGDSDPHSAKITYPPYKVGDSIAEKLLLTTDSNRSWTLPQEDKVSVVSEIWASIHNKDEDEPMRRGNRLIASLSFLKKLCLEFQSELIIEVQIRRWFRYKSYRRREESDEYKPPLSKVFIFSADGRLRDTETYYELRQSISEGT